MLRGGGKDTATQWTPVAGEPVRARPRTLECARAHTHTQSVPSRVQKQQSRMELHNARRGGHTSASL